MRGLHALCVIFTRMVHGRGWTLVDDITDSGSSLLDSHARRVISTHWAPIEWRMLQYARELNFRSLSDFWVASTLLNSTGMFSAQTVMGQWTAKLEQDDQS